MAYRVLGSPFGGLYGAMTLQIILTKKIQVKVVDNAADHCPTEAKGCTDLPVGIVYIESRVDARALALGLVHEGTHVYLETPQDAIYIGDTALRVQRAR